MQRISDWIDSIPKRLKRRAAAGSGSGQRHDDQNSLLPVNVEDACCSISSNSKKQKRIWSSSVSAASGTKLSLIIGRHRQKRKSSKRPMLDAVDMDTVYQTDLMCTSSSTFDSGKIDSAYLQQMRQTWRHACSTIQSTSSEEEARSELASHCLYATTAESSCRKGLTLPLNRPLIRTNPWICKTDKSGSRPDTMDDRGYSSLLRIKKNGGTASIEKGRDSCPLLGTTQSFKSLEGNRRRIIRDTEKKDEMVLLDESMSSSGYGSQDSSPESSVINPDWNIPPSTSQQVADTEMYTINNINSNNGRKFDERCAKLPYFDEADSENEKARSEETDKLVEMDFNGNSVYSPPKLIFRRHKTSGPGGRPPSFHAPPPPPVPPMGSLVPSLPKSTNNCGALAQLDASMAVLRAKGVELEEVFVRTKETRKKRLQEKQLCLEHVQWIKEQLKFLRPAPNFEILL